MKFTVIGISDNPQPFFPPEVMAVIQRGKVFSGGKRHHDIVNSLLPAGAQWIDITVPLDHVFEQYAQHPLFTEKTKEGLIIFASGDPLFFGFANTLQRTFPHADIQVFPSFNSLQLLAHRLVMAYHDMSIVSLTGRPWPAFDTALIERAEKIGILTDRQHTPAAIALRMLDYGYSDYAIHVGEHLGNPNLEKVTTLSLEEASSRQFSSPNCVILTSNTSPRVPRPFGIPDSSFVLLDGREKMITKMPIRLLTLQALGLPKRHVLWDIGFCTGSISIEARLQFPHLQIEAFEIRPECESIIQENMRHHGAPGIGIHMGDFLDYSDTIAASPDAVFIGGHGGRLKEIMAKVLQYLSPDGVIVMNSVVAPKVPTDSRQLWDEACNELGLHQEPPLHIQLNDHHPITILTCRR